MNILHFSSATSWRGGEQQIAYLAKELRAANIEQVILCVTNSPLASFCEQENIPFYTYKKKASIAPGPAVKLAKIARLENISLVHIHDAHAHTFAVVAATFFGLQTPLILSRRVDFPIKRSILSKWKYNHTAIKAIICVSHFIKEIIAPDISDTSKIEVIHSGVDLSKFQFKKSGILRN